MNASVRYLLALAALALIFGLSGCGKKEESKSEKNSTSATKEGTMPQGTPFSLTNQHGLTRTVILQEKKVALQGIDKPVVILHFFTTWSLPCRGEAPYLSDLQVKYKKEVELLGILLHPDNYLQELDSFVTKNRLAYFISSGSQNDALAKAVAGQLALPDTLPIPLTVIYHDGRYYKHYEGAVPVEMLVHDIDTLLK